MGSGRWDVARLTNHDKARRFLIPLCIAIGLNNIDLLRLGPRLRLDVELPQLLGGSLDVAIGRRRHGALG